LQTGELLHTLKGHTNQVSSLAISYNGQIIASGSSDKTIKLWDLQTGELLHTLEGHSDGVTSLAISQNRKFIASGSQDKTIRIWSWN
jgi:WD40 repeat protein